jgi:hypothetical protein
MNGRLKILLKTYVLVFLFIMFFCTALLADNRELTASWERDAVGRIWGEYVLDRQNSITARDNFRINALCDHRAFEEVATVRKEMLSAVRDAISAGRVSEAADFYGYMLEVYASIGIAPLRGEERMLLSSLLVKKRHRDKDMRLAGDGRRGDGTLAVSEAAVSINPPRDAGRDYTDRRNKVRINSFTGSVNLSIYSLRFNKVDYFSLILYLWEDNPFDRNSNTTCGSRLEAIPASLISHNLQTHLSGKKPQDSFNRDSKGETQSGVFLSVSLDCSHNRYLLPSSLWDSERVFSAVLGSERFRGTGGSF